MMSEDNLSRVIEYVFAHRKEPVQNFLRDREISSAGTKDVLRTRVTEAINDGLVTIDELITLLDTIEGWGNQHVYLYDAPPGELANWKNEAKVRASLKESGYLDLFNNMRPLVLPDEPTLSTIEWTVERVRFIWVEKREWSMRRTEMDKTGKEFGLADTISFKAYEYSAARGLTSFDWNLNTGKAALMIQRLPSGEQYDEIRESYEEVIGEMIRIEDFS